MHLPTAKNEAKVARTPLEFWSSLFTEDLLAIIVRNTNIEIQNFLTKKQWQPSPTFRELDVLELKAFIGLMYYSGARKDHDVRLERLWDNKFGCAIYSSAFSLRSFQFIFSRLRFDERLTRERRRAEDGLAAIRDIGDIFITNCSNNYSPSDYLTIDEQLLSFRGRFSGRVYIKKQALELRY